MQLQELQKRQIESTPVSAPLLGMKQKLTEQLNDPATPPEEKQMLQARIDSLERMMGAQKPKAAPLSPEDRAKLSSEIALPPPPCPLS